MKKSLFCEKRFLPNMDKKIKLISGTANPKLAEEISSFLNVPLTPVEIKRFSDGEIYCKVLQSVRGSHIFVIQPTSPDANQNLMELLILVDALKRASAKEITAVLPYYGYARQDRKVVPREPITAKLVANLIMTSGINRVVTFDLHVEQIQGFFDIPLDNLEALPLIAEYFLDKKFKNTVVVSPDAGGTARARKLAEFLNASLAIIDKRRPKHDEAIVMHIIGDVENKTAILADDIIDTGGTIVSASKALLEHGAKEVYVCATHPVFSGEAIHRLEASSIKEIVITNTISIPKEKRINKLKIISIAPLLAESIKRIYEGIPMGVLFNRIYDKLSQKRGK